MIIGGYQSCSLCDYPGKVASVVFTQGCNFRCPFCHNGSLLPLAAPERFISINEILDRLKHRRSRIDSVVISGGEPTLQDDIAAFLDNIRSIGLSIKLDTNGSRPQMLRTLFQAGLIDYVAMDIKAPFEKYEELTGVRTPVKMIIESIELIAKNGISHEFRTTFVPALLTEDDLAVIREQVPFGSPHKVQPFKPEHALDERLRIV